MEIWNCLNRKKCATERTRDMREERREKREGGGEIVYAEVRDDRESG